VKLRTIATVALAGALAIALTGCGSKAADSKPAGPAKAELTGSINIAGSDTMVNLAQAWAEKFQTDNPGVMIAVKGGGSGNGIAALINGTVDAADASRNIKDEEKADAQAKGVTPVETAVANDGISVIVNPANKVADLTKDQLGKIYRGEITNWKDVGGADAPIVLVGRDTSSGTYEYFKEAVVGKDKEYAKSMRNLQSSQAIVDEVAKNPNAVGYVGLGYAQNAQGISRIKVDGVEDTVDNVLSKTYPLSRQLYMVSNGAPADLLKAYVDWILSPAGQKVVEEQGFVPLAK
jgi:phosphate transport system substrate-binding protein